ncbi:MAG: glycosyltransferase family 4 protein [Candidatus Bathyarchaeia archaeon]
MANDSTRLIRMNILFIAHRYLPYLGGVEYVVKSIAERLAEMGCNVSILCGDPSVNGPNEELIKGVRVVRWPVLAPKESYYFPAIRHRLERWLLDAGKNNDVIHVHSVHSMLSLYSLTKLKNCKAIKVITPHYHGTGHTLFRKILWSVWKHNVRKALRWVDVVHTVSQTEAQLVSKDFGLTSVTIEHGVDEWLSNLSWNPSNYVFYSGRIEKYKNIHRLANIVRILRILGSNFELKIFGDGPFKSKLINHLNRLKINYDLKPPQPYIEYINTLSKAVLFGLLSQKEAYGQTVNEANAIGVPVVVVEPWGLTFSKRHRTLVTQLCKSDISISKEIVVFLNEAKKQPRSKIPSWRQVVGDYVKLLYENNKK